VAAVNAVQDQLAVRAGSEAPFVIPDYDRASFDATRNALLERARGIHGFAGAFGRRKDVHPELHLIGSAAGWDGLPEEEEAYYVNQDPGPPSGNTS
jgi:hypothetical protein